MLTPERLPCISLLEELKGANLSSNNHTGSLYYHPGFQMKEHQLNAWHKVKYPVVAEQGSEPSTMGPWIVTSPGTQHSINEERIHSLYYVPVELGYSNGEQNKVLLFLK